MKSTHGTPQQQTPRHGAPRPEVAAWFVGQLPDDWFIAPPEVSLDSEEILVVGELPGVDLGEDSDAEARTVAELSRISRFREDTRERRMRIAEDAERHFEQQARLVGGEGRRDDPIIHDGERSGDDARLRLAERQVLDTLIDAGVARSRSDALAWCVRLVARNEASWITELRGAFEQVEEVRSRGPASTQDQG